MIGMLISNQFNTAQNWALGSAMAVVLILCTLIVVAVAAAIMWMGRMMYGRATRVVMEGV
jgi:spermidine/putrescine transport system permease protein